MRTDRFKSLNRGKEVNQGKLGKWDIFRISKVLSDGEGAKMKSLHFGHRKACPLSSLFLVRGE